MKTFTTTTALFTAFIALVAATPLNHAGPSQGTGAGSPHFHGGHNGSHHHPSMNNGNHTINGTSTIRMTVTHTRTSTIFAEPTQFNNSAPAMATDGISAPFTPIDMANATPTPSSDESDDAGLAAATGLW
ncbi:hypothetical protein PtrSN002B_002822 [Pyrenophora tritici-repentis]|uniref:Tymo-45kd-70kd domain containing protein n=2 Tax=Pyrenophora tritici-repentis TaxID=45151 RepID=A0A2W1DVZ3_9PLEO|nr:uncharacterized protein PTRG_01339 [Pyrenophora tritici-repentis Pt-1C-BFP]KAA8625991.1 hypothetical protein PtrV1_01671 [Pyrenophora tritici-repentis]EDU40777.1 hypothetical protein PTRG_01339 [Pyrenophora tritici-repentis Pt-1C-BFP]KAF7454403.1 hypothetical protein A1F99_016610 [Pyrenophora tritici-repentis]KAF7577523.1 Tymo-45kd-70kd domain containing protein [Pyrenophora tritici-repentis]KAG9388151.1 hypothetical protein A1F94_001043 [Pyrenophora tritici-repentis]